MLIYTMFEAELRLRNPSLMNTTSSHVRTTQGEGQLVGK